MHVSSHYALLLQQKDAMELSVNEHQDVEQQPGFGQNPEINPQNTLQNHQGKYI